MAKTKKELQEFVVKVPADNVCRHCGRVAEKRQYVYVFKEGGYVEPHLYCCMNCLLRSAEDLTSCFEDDQK